MTIYSTSTIFKTVPQESEASFQSSFSQHRLPVTKRILVEKCLWVISHYIQVPLSWRAKLLNSEPQGWLMRSRVIRTSVPVVSRHDELWPLTLTCCAKIFSCVYKKLRALLLTINFSSHVLKNIFCTLQGSLKLSELPDKEETSILMTSLCSCPLSSTFK